jgi:hypothetical protein
VLGVKIISLYQYSEKSNAIIMNKAEFKDEGVSSIHITKNPRDRNKKYMIDATNLSSVTLLLYYYYCFPSAAGLPAALPLELSQPPRTSSLLLPKYTSASRRPVHLLLHLGLPQLRPCVPLKESITASQLSLPPMLMLICLAG